MKRLMILSLVLGLMAGAVSTAEAHRAEAGLSGTIVTGAWWDAYLNGATGCQTAPECRAWVGSGCQPALTGRALTERDPALMASIEDVADLAEDASWRFDWENGYSDNAGWVVVQLWRENCTEIRSRKWCSVSGCDPYSANPTSEPRDHSSTVLRIPSSARFMTVTGWPYLPWPGEFVSEPAQRPIIDWTLTAR